MDNNTAETKETTDVANQLEPVVRCRLEEMTIVREKKSDAYLAGWKSYYSHGYFGENPYQDGTQEYEDWEDGQADAGDNEESHQPD